MVEELVVVRHAEAVEGDPVGRDADRALTAAGEQAADEVGKWLSSEAVVADRVVASPAVRARETTRRVCAAIGFTFDEVLWVDLVYGASVPVLLQILEEQGNGASRVLLVGHNPGLAELVRHLLGAKAPGRFPPGAAVRIRVQGTLRERGTGGLVDRLIPGRQDHG